MAILFGRDGRFNILLQLHSPFRIHQLHKFIKELHR